MLVMSDRGGGINVVEGGGGLAYGTLFWFCLGLFHGIPHSSLAYDTGVIGGKRDLVQPNLWLGGMWKWLTWPIFSYVNMRHFPIMIYEYL